MPDATLPANYTETKAYGTDDLMVTSMLCDMKGNKFVATLELYDAAATPPYLGKIIVVEIDATTMKVTKLNGDKQTETDVNFDSAAVQALCDKAGLVTLLTAQIADLTKNP